MQEELSTLPPKTGEILQQPSVDELAAAAATANSARSSSSGKIPKVVLIGSGLFVIGCIVGAVGVIVGRNAATTSPVSPPVLVESPVPSEVATVAAQAASLVMRTLLEDGSFVSTFDPLGYALDSQWQDRGLAFDLSYLFYIPNLSIVEIEVDPLIDPSKPLFVLQLEVTDTRLTGAAQQIQAHTYLSARHKTVDYPAPPFFEQLQINPGERKKLFVPVQIPVTTETFLLLSGDLGNPVVTEVVLPALIIETAPRDDASEATAAGEVSL